MDFSSRVLSYIRDQHLCAFDARLIVGVSGGADSVALLYFLHCNGFQCIVAHCNFHLRENDSDNDEIFVRNLAKEWSLPFFSQNFDTKRIASERGISIEMAARDLRYEWFDTLLIAQNADAIAVAHHADDAIETFFINLARGSGLKGLLGIRPSQGNVIRPFLSVNRDDIINYLNTKNLNFRTDITNFDQTIVRNKIRHTIIPAFESLNPSFRESMLGNFARLADAYSVANDQVENAKQHLFIDQGDYLSIPIDQLKEQGNLSFYLYELLHPYLFSAATIHDILLHIDGESGKQFFSPTHRLIKDRNHLLLSTINNSETAVYTIDSENSSIDIPIGLIVSDAMKADVKAIERKPEVAFVDFHKLKFPLELRHPRAGDFFFPFGNMGKKKLSDFFIDQKWNLFQKEQCWLLTSDNQIVWVIGHRLDNRFRIDQQSKIMLKITFL